MQSARRMDEGVVTSEKCWSSIEEKMPENLKRIELVEKWNVLEKDIFKSDPKILTEEKIGELGKVTRTS